MGDLSLFLKSNKRKLENEFYPATKSLVDENGKPLEWELRPVSTRKNEEIREACTIEVPVRGKPGLFREKFDSKKYALKLITEAVVYPDLHSTELQDSYGVMSAEDLILEMVDSLGEFTALSDKIRIMSGFDDNMLQEKVDDAKNA